MERDHPIVENLLRTGYPDGKAPIEPHCPVCGEECSEIYADRYGDIFGCDECIKKSDAWEVADCFPQEE